MAGEEIETGANGDEPHRGGEGATAQGKDFLVVDTPGREAAAEVAASEECG